MRQESFEKKNNAVWEAYDLMLSALDKPVSKNQQAEYTTDFPQLYRKICHHYAIALSRQYSPALVSKLHGQIMAGHRKIYKKNIRVMPTIVSFFSETFPITFRMYFPVFILALILFVVPYVGAGVAGYLNQDIIYAMMSEKQVADFEYMYDPENKTPGRTQDKSSDKSVMMFGYYIKNNISIGFRTFASGILAGIGTVFALIFNGVMLGGVSGHVTRLGFTSTFWPFVSGHSAFELTAVVISGMAGLLLAWAIIAPGNYKRTDALKIKAPKALVLVLGAATMLLIAAFIEAFWSPSSVPIPVKYFVAVIFWCLVIGYLALTGRRKSVWT